MSQSENDDDSGTATGSEGAEDSEGHESILSIGGATSKHDQCCGRLAEATLAILAYVPVASQSRLEKMLCEYCSLAMETQRALDVLTDLEQALGQEDV